MSEIDTSTERFNRWADTLDAYGNMLDVDASWQVSALRAIAAERDALKAEVERMRDDLAARYASASRPMIERLHDIRGKDCTYGRIPFCDCAHYAQHVAHLEAGHAKQ